VKHEIIEHVPALRRFAYSLTGSPEDADDLLQGTIERVLTKGVPDDVNLLKWMFRVCRNMWIDEYRSRKVRMTAAEKPELRENNVVDGERIVHGQITLGEVNRAMATLPDEQRSVISLVAVEGLSYKEVSDILSIPIGTVQSRLSRARVALMNCLENSGERSPA